MNVIIDAPIFGQSGFEGLSRGLAIGLQKIGVDVRLVERTDWNAESCILNTEDEARLNYMLQMPLHTKNYNYIIHQYPRNIGSCWNGATKKYCYTLFETSLCPVPWVSKLNLCDETWVFSDFNKETFNKSFVTNVEVIPFGVDTKLFTPKVEPFQFGRKDEFVFLTCGDYTERKNFEGLIEAYVKEFTCKDNVLLVIKAHYGGFTKRHQNNCIAKFREIVKRFNPIDPPRILFLGNKIPSNDMPKFYTAGDCFVLTSRGEGIGLPYAESLACGIPVIATNWGGQAQFLNNSNSLLVNFELRQIDDMEYIRKCLWALNHSWAFPAVGDTREKLRFAYEFRGLMKEKGLKGRADMEKMTWQNAAIKVLDRMVKGQEKVCQKES